MLKEIIEQKHYCFTQSFQSWEDAIRASYQPLLQDGIVEDIYVQAVIDCVKKYGPYIVIVPNIAMPHSTEGAKGLILILKILIKKQDSSFPWLLLIMNNI